MDGIGPGMLETLAIQAYHCPRIKPLTPETTMTDLLLAMLHHVVMFALFGALAVELTVVRPGMSTGQVALAARIDRVYGLLAMLVIVIGFSRAVFAAKGWDYYSHNGWFWAKIATFALVGALSALPTMRFIRWRRASHRPDDAEVARVRRLLHAQAALFFLIPVFAAAMARGYGSFA
jgi:putative membrane protein